MGNPYTPTEQSYVDSMAAAGIVVTLTDDIYWDAQPHPVQALRNMPVAIAGDRDTAAMKLAQQGFAIDVPIMAWGWSPVCVMCERIQYGYTWTPTALQSPILLPPGLSFPGLPSYDPNHPPAGSIKVSVNAADYPAVDPPVPPPPPTATNVVGPHNFGKYYYPGPGAIGLTDGTQVTQNGVPYTYHLVAGLMGPSAFFTQP